MDDQRHAAALTDEAVGDEVARDIARALAIDPSPDFLARVRTRIASEPLPRPSLGAAFSTWRWPVAIAAVTLLLAVVVLNRPRAPIVGVPLVSRTTAFDATTLPYVASAFRRTLDGPAKAGRHILRQPLFDGQALIDPRETQALRALLAGIRNNRVDLSPLLAPTAPAPTEMPAASDLVITPIAIEPLAPVDGAPGPIPRDSASSGQGERQ
jgi:hypothetical protein